MTIVMPGIIFWLLILLLVWFLTNLIWNNEAGDRLMVISMGASILGTIAYIGYALYWIWTHWHNIPVHINLT